MNKRVNKTRESFMQYVMGNMVRLGREGLVMRLGVTVTEETNWFLAQAQVGTGGG